MSLWLIDATPETPVPCLGLAPRGQADGQTEGQGVGHVERPASSHPPLPTSLPASKREAEGRAQPPLQVGLGRVLAPVFPGEGTHLGVV